MRKVLRKEVTVGGRFEFFWTLPSPLIAIEAASSCSLNCMRHDEKY